MTLTDQGSGGVTLLLRDASTPTYYPPATTGAAHVELWQHDGDKGIETAVKVGEFKPGSDFSIEYNPTVDRNAVLRTVSVSASGTKSVSDLRDAVAATLLHQRETAAPIIGQNAPATMNEVEIGITNFTRFARSRRITVSEHADMSDPVAVLLFDSETYVARELPRYFTLQREAGGFTTESGDALTTEAGDLITTETSAGALARTVYVTVAHSSGVAWTPESNVLEVTFAAGDGTGGSGGDFDPTPRDNHNLDEL